MLQESSISYALCSIKKRLCPDYVFVKYSSILRRHSRDIVYFLWNRGSSSLGFISVSISHICNYIYYYGFDFDRIRFIKVQCLFRFYFILTLVPWDRATISRRPKKVAFDTAHHHYRCLLSGSEIRSTVRSMMRYTEEHVRNCISQSKITLFA